MTFVYCSDCGKKIMEYELFNDVFSTEITVTHLHTTTKKMKCPKNATAGVKGVR